MLDKSWYMFLKRGWIFVAYANTRKLTELCNSFNEHHTSNVLPNMLLWDNAVSFSNDSQEAPVSNQSTVIVSTCHSWLGSACRHRFEPQQWLSWVPILRSHAACMVHFWSSAWSWERRSWNYKKSFLCVTVIQYRKYSIWCGACFLLYYLPGGVQEECVCVVMKHLASKRLPLSEKVICCIWDGDQTRMFDE